VNDKHGHLGGACIGRIPKYTGRRLPVAARIVQSPARIDPRH
jgi:hypothetical protein